MTSIFLRSGHLLSINAWIHLPFIFCSGLCWGFPGGSVVKNLCQCKSLRRHGFDPWIRKITWRRKWQPTPVFLARTIPWTEESGGLQSMGLQRVRRNWAHMHTELFSSETHIAPECWGGAAAVVFISLCLNRWLLYCLHLALGHRSGNPGNSVLFPSPSWSLEYLFCFFCLPVKLWGSLVFLPRSPS